MRISDWSSDVCSSDLSPEAAPQPEADSAPREAVRRQVLVIDDEPDITGFLVEVLEAAGHSVDVAASGQEALELLRAQDYAAIICDLRMPHLDGPGLYEALKSLKPQLLGRTILHTRSTEHTSEPQ